MRQNIEHKNESIKHLRNHLIHLTNELNKTTEYIQIIETQDESKSRSNSINLVPEQEISQLLQKQNAISHEIILVKKRIQKLSAKTILKIELVILPVVIVLLFFMIANYMIQPTEVNHILKTRYVIENIRGNMVDDYMYWNLSRSTPLYVNIENNEYVDNQKLQAVKDAVLSTDTVVDSGSSPYGAESGTGKFFKGWQGALQDVSRTKQPVPTKFNIMQSNSGEGQIVITFATLHHDKEYSGITRTIVDGNQILKSFITIYDIDKLNDNQISTIVRQEFGHALGLPDTSNTSDLMHESITNTSYISECDVHALEKSYDGIKPSKDFCS